MYIYLHSTPGQCTTGNPVAADPATFSNPVPVPAKYWPDFILFFK